MSTNRRRGLTHLAILFVVWGTTYLAIRVAVAPGGFAPMWMGALRVALAGASLLAFAHWRGRSLRLPQSEWATLALGGLLIWSAGNGLVMVAEMEVTSSVAALVAATTPGWVVLFEAVIDHRWPTRSTWLAIAAGSLGVLVLQSDPTASGLRAGPLASLLFAAMCFAAGMVAHKRLPVRAPVSVRAGYELLLATAGFITLALARDEPISAPSADAWIAFVYLVVFGSVIGFTSFIRATELLPTSLVSTHAFVNPIVAVLLGWLLLDESITWRTGVSAALIVAAVIWLLRAPATEAAPHISKARFASRI